MKSRATKWTAVLILVLTVFLMAKNIDLIQAGTSSPDPIKNTSRTDAGKEDMEEEKIQEAIQALSFQVQNSFLESGSEEINIQSPDSDCEKRKTVCEAEN